MISGYQDNQNSFSKILPKLCKCVSYRLVDEKTYKREIPSRTTIMVGVKAIQREQQRIYQEILHVYIDYIFV